MTRFHKFVATLLSVMIFTGIVPTAAAVDMRKDVVSAFGEQVIAEQELASLTKSEYGDLLTTKSGQFLQDSGDGGYVIYEKNDLSFDDKTALLEQLDELDVPVEVKEEVLSKYNNLSSSNNEKNVVVSVLVGTQKINSNGRSYLDEPTIIKNGRKFKVYPIISDHLKIDEKVVEGNDVVPFLQATNELALNIYGTFVEMSKFEKYSLLVVTGFLTLYDYIENKLSHEITGSRDNYHKIEIEYSGTTNMYYLYSDALNGWNHVLTTGDVTFHSVHLETYACVEVRENYYKGQVVDQLTCYNIHRTTPSCENPFDVAIQYQFLPLYEEISFKYQGHWFYF